MYGHGDQEPSIQIQYFIQLAFPELIFFFQKYFLRKTSEVEEKLLLNNGIIP